MRENIVDPDSDSDGILKLAGITIPIQYLGKAVAIGPANKECAVSWCCFKCFPFVYGLILSCNPVLTQYSINLSCWGRIFSGSPAFPNRVVVTGYSR